ncbi:hypothetical protein E0H22_25190 [Rhodopseudomonas boonkerdii]|nr:hypothetical protein E0H22_25190 [Rhodopseudomonas boonkerdii]
MLEGAFVAGKRHYDFPAEHGKHLRMATPIESNFRHRAIRSKGRWTCRALTKFGDSSRQPSHCALQDITNWRYE